MPEKKKKKMINIIIDVYMFYVIISAKFTARTPYFRIKSPECFEQYYYTICHSDKIII